jgi:hypothetical protein
MTISLLAEALPDFWQSEKRAYFCHPVAKSSVLLQPDFFFSPWFRQRSSKIVVSTGF